MAALTSGQRQRAAGAAMVGIFAFKVAYSGFMPPFAELLLSRACVSLGLPAYPAQECSNSDEASSVAAIRSGYYNLATTIPALITVSMYSMMADVRGRKGTLSLCFLSGLLQAIVVWLLPAGRVCLGGACIEDSFWLLLCVCGALSCFGSWNVALGTSFAVVADLTEGPQAANRAMLFGIMEAFNISGSIFGPVATGYLAKYFGLQHSFLFVVAGSAVALFCSSLVYVETLPQGSRKKWDWKQANPIGSVCMLVQHPILIRFLLLLLFVDMSQNQQLTLYYTRLAGFGEEANGIVTTVSAAACAFGLLFVLPVMTKKMPMKWLIVFAVTGSTIGLFMNAMLTWPIIKHWPGVEAWPYWCAVSMWVMALWYPPMRATAATIFGPEKFAMALGAVATVQTTNSVVGPTIWPVIYALSLKGCDDDGSSSGSGSPVLLGDGSSGSGSHLCMPALVFYISTAWCLMGCFVALSFPPLEKEDLQRASQSLNSSGSGAAGSRSGSGRGSMGAEDGVRLGSNSLQHFNDGLNRRSGGSGRRDDEYAQPLLA